MNGTRLTVTVKKKHVIEAQSPTGSVECYAVVILRIIFMQFEGEYSRSFKDTQ